MKNAIIIIIGILIGIIILVLVKNSRTSQPPSSPPLQIETITSPTPDVSLLNYTDPSGFSFRYPEKIMVKSKKTDSAVYSSLLLSGAGSAETITVQVEESNLNSVDDWFKGAKKTSVFGDIQKIKLADLDARQFEANNAKTTIALDQAVLFTISTDAKKGSDVSNAYDRIIGSFAFAQPTQAVQNSSQGASNNSSDVVEEEDIVE